MTIHQVPDSGSHCIQLKFLDLNNVVTRFSQAFGHSSEPRPHGEWIFQENLAAFQS
jgi:hypothetical protein